MNYFKNVNTLEELKQNYRKLVKKFHPDLATGSLETMKVINNQYDSLFEELKKVGTKAEQAEDVSIFKDIINAIVNLEGIKIEIVGSWIWLSGNTFTHKEIIKKQGFKWSKKRKMWYFSDDLGEKRKRGTNQGFDEIRMTYGSRIIETKNVQKLA